MTVIDLIPSLKGKDPNYIDFVQTQYNSFKTASEVPPIFMGYTLNNQMLPNRLSIFYNRIFDIVYNRYSYLFCFKNHKDTGLLANCVIDNYFKVCIENGYNVEHILFIDTKLLLQDFTKLISSKSNGVKPALTYTLETLYREIELAPCVIWDNFEFLTTPFEKNKITEILNARYRRMLGNLFFVEGNWHCLDYYEAELHKLMNPGAVLQCQNEQVEFIPFVEKEGDIVW